MISASNCCHYVLFTGTSEKGFKLSVYMLSSTGIEVRMSEVYIQDVLQSHHSSVSPLLRMVAPGSPSSQMFLTFRPKACYLCGNTTDTTDMSVYVEHQHQSIVSVAEV